MRHVVISPHPDDAVWSCGGLLDRLRSLGHDVVIVTVFDADVDGAYGAPWRRVATPRLRRAENNRALAELCLSGVSVGLADAALRRAADGRFVYPVPEALFGPPDRLDVSLTRSIAQAVETLIDEDTIVHVPLALGGHIDHILSRRACTALTSKLSRWLYAEFPYQMVANRGRRLVTIPVPVKVESWLAASMQYRSQIRTLFGTNDRFREDLLLWAGGNGVGVHHVHFDSERSELSRRVLADVAREGVEIDDLAGSPKAPCGGLPEVPLLEEIASCSGHDGSLIYWDDVDSLCEEEVDSR